MTKNRSKAFLARSEVARLFHVSPVTVVRWAEQGRLPSELTLGGQRRYPRKGTLAVLSEVTRGARAPRRTESATGERGRVSTRRGRRTP
jgi:predicted site-specific integrase-resolvase